MNTTPFRTTPPAAAPAPVVNTALQRMNAVEDDTCIGRVMLSLGTKQTVPAGATIFIEGDDADTVYHIVSGVVRCCRITIDGRRQISRFLVQGDEMGMTARDIYAYTAEAVGDVVLHRISRAAFRGAMRGDAALSDALFDHMATTLNATRDQMVLLGQLNAAERAACFLIEMAERVPEPDGGIHLVMNRQDIGDYLGMTLETVSRMFNRFKKEGVIAMATPDHIRIQDFAALEMAAGTV